MEQDATRVSLRDILDIIFKRKGQLLAFFFATFCTVAVGTYLVKPTYEATAQLLIKMGRESVFVPASGDVGPIINYDREERINGEIEILKSQSLAEKVVLAMGPTVLYEELKEEKPGLIARIKTGIKKRFFPERIKILSPDERREWNLKIATLDLQKNLEVEGAKKSNIVQVKFKHENPRLVSMVVNNLTEIYLDRHLEVHKTPKSHEFFKEQAELLKHKLEQAEARLKSLKKKHKITSLEEERSLLLGQAASLRTDLNQTVSQEVETEIKIRQIRQQMAATPRTIAQGEETHRNQELIASLEARLVELELKEKELLTKYTDQSRLVLRVAEEIKMVRNRLDEQEKKSYGRKRSGVNPTYQNLQQEFFRNETELNALKAKGQTQKTQLADYQRKLAELNQIDVKINQLKQQVDVDRQNYRLYLSKFEESRISDAMDAEKISSVSIIEPARPPLRPVSPKVRLNLLMAIFLGAFGGIGLAFFMEYLDDSLKRPEDVEAYLGLPVLASIPELK